MSSVKLRPVNKIFTDALSSDKLALVITEGTAEGADKVTLLGALNSTTSVTDTAYTVLSTDDAVYVDDTTAGGTVTVTLPPAAEVGNGYEVTVKKTGNTYHVIVDGNGSETIDGGLTARLTVQYESITCKSDGSNWLII